MSAAADTSGGVELPWLVPVALLGDAEMVGRSPTRRAPPPKAHVSRVLTRLDLDNPGADRVAGARRKVALGLGCRRRLRPGTD